MRLKGTLAFVGVFVNIAKRQERKCRPPLVTLSNDWGVGEGGYSGFVEMDFVSVYPLLKLIQPDPVWQVGSIIVYSSFKNRNC